MSSCSKCILITLVIFFLIISRVESYLLVLRAKCGPNFEFVKLAGRAAGLIYLQSAGRGGLKNISGVRGGLRAFFCCCGLNILARTQL